MINEFSTQSEIEQRLKEIIDDVQKEADLEQRLKEAFKNNKSHIKYLSKM